MTKHVTAILRDGTEKDYDHDENPEIRAENGSYFIEFTDDDMIALPMDLVEEIQVCG